MGNEDEDEDTLAPEAQALIDAIEKAQRAIVGVVPTAGAATSERVAELRALLDDARGRQDGVLAALSEAQRTSVKEALAHTYLGAAVVAIAAGDGVASDEWLEAAAQVAESADARAEVLAAKAHPEAFRELSYGRYLFGHDQERAARKVWSALAKSAPKEIAGLATVELEAPRALGDGEMPSLGRIYGCGLGFYGRRARWRDGSYATTHCISLLFVPLIPLRAYRVIDRDGGYLVLAREQLSKFAKIARVAVLASAAFAVVAWGVAGVVNDPARKARGRVDAALQEAASAEPADAVARLTSLWEGEAFAEAGAERAAKVGALYIRRSAELVPRPVAAPALDAVARWASGVAALPKPVGAGAAREAALAQVDAWLAEVGESPEVVDVRLALLRHGSDLAGPESMAWRARVREVQVAFAKSREADDPLEALGLIAELPGAESMSGADALVAKLVETAPSLLVDAELDLKLWATVRPSSDAMDALARAKAARASAGLGPAAGEAPEVVSDAVAQDHAKALRDRPWDQHAALALARADVAAGRLDEAARRIEALGRPGWVLRDARMMLGQIQVAQGKLAEADATLTAALGGRVTRYASAVARLERAFSDKQAKLIERARQGALPSTLLARIETASDDEQMRLFNEWAGQQLESDADLVAIRARVEALSDVVPISVTLGTVKLRRAQVLPESPERDAMLRAAERAFLAIRSGAAESAELRIGLGEIYARLGKDKESEAELGAALADNDPVTNMTISEVYRRLGKVTRATEVARAVYEQPGVPEQVRYNAATQLALLAGSIEESEEWYRKADPQKPFVQAALLELEGQKALQRGDTKECAKKFERTAALHLGQSRTDPVNLNNAAISYQRGYDCNGDLSLLGKAEVALEKAHRTSSDNALVTANYQSVLETVGYLRIMGKHVELRVLPLRKDDAETLLASLLDGPSAEATLILLRESTPLRRAAELAAIHEVLASSSAHSYRSSFWFAKRLRDEKAAEAIVARARRAKAIDRASLAAGRASWHSGEHDEEVFGAKVDLTVYQRAIDDPKASGKTKAAALVSLAETMQKRGVYKRDLESLILACGHFGRALALWPELALRDALAACSIDLAATRAGVADWASLRRERSAAASLQQLLRKGDASAQTILAAGEWRAALEHLRLDASRPGVDALLIARIAGDAALEAKVRGVLDDKILHLRAELDLILDPDDPEAKETLQILDGK